MELPVVEAVPLSERSLQSEVWSPMRLSAFSWFATISDTHEVSLNEYIRWLSMNETYFEFRVDRAKSERSFANPFQAHNEKVEHYLFC